MSWTTQLSGEAMMTRRVLLQSASGLLLAPVVNA